MKLRTYFFNLRRKFRTRFLKNRKKVDEAMYKRKEGTEDNFNVEKEKPRLAGRASTGFQ